MDWAVRRLASFHVVCNPDELRVRFQDTLRFSVLAAATPTTADSSALPIATTACACNALRASSLRQRACSCATLGWMNSVRRLSSNGSWLGLGLRGFGRFGRFGLRRRLIRSAPPENPFELGQINALVILEVHYYNYWIVVA